jgi:hypothetical protein
MEKVEAIAEKEKLLGEILSHVVPRDAQVNFKKSF